MKRKVRFEGHYKGQGHHNFPSIHFQKRVDDWMWEQKQILYLDYHTAIISVLMSKLKATRFFGDLESKVKVINEVKVIQK